MKVEYFPYFCGGRILFGIHNNPGKDKPQEYRTEYWLEEGAYRTLMDKATGKTKCEELGHDNYPYLPHTFEAFAFIMRQYISLGTGSPAGMGVMIAVTNEDQTDAYKWLTAIGFKEAAFTGKYRQPNCHTLVGDIWEDVWPKVRDAKAPNFVKVEEHKSIFKKEVPVDTARPAIAVREASPQAESEKSSPTRAARSREASSPKTGRNTLSGITNKKRSLEDITRGIARNTTVRKRTTRSPRSI